MAAYAPPATGFVNGLHPIRPGELMLMESLLMCSVLSSCSSLQRAACWGRVCVGLCTPARPLFLPRVPPPLRLLLNKPVCDAQHIW